MNFTEDQIKDIEQLAGLNYTVRQIALYLDVNKYALQHEFENTESVFRYHYNRGQLIAQAEIDKSNLQSAKSGNITAMIRYDKKNKENALRIAKERIFGYS